MNGLEVEEDEDGVPQTLLPDGRNIRTLKLDDVLNDTDLLMLFRRYTKDTRSEENLNLWIEIENFERLSDTEAKGRAADEILFKVDLDCSLSPHKPSALLDLPKACLPSAIICFMNTSVIVY